MYDELNIKACWFKTISGLIKNITIFLNNTSIIRYELEVFYFMTALIGLLILSDIQLG